MTLIAIEEHWILPDLTCALTAMPPHLRDESLAFNEMGDHQQRLEDLGAGRIAAMDAQGIDVSILALTPPGTQPLPPEDALRLSRSANDVAAAAVSSNPSRFRSLVDAAHVVTSMRSPASSSEPPAWATSAPWSTADQATSSSTTPSTTTSSLPHRNVSASRCSSIRNCHRLRFATRRTAASTP